MSQDTSHSSFHNSGENVDGYGIGVYRSRIIHSPSHNIAGHGRSLVLSVASNPVHGSVHGD